MTKSTEARAAVRTVRKLFDEGETRGAFAFVASIQDDEVYEAVVKAYPGIVNYDAKGNWVGPVANG